MGNCGGKSNKHQQQQENHQSAPQSQKHESKKSELQQKESDGFQVPQRPQVPEQHQSNQHNFLAQQPNFHIEHSLGESRDIVGDLPPMMRSLNKAAHKNSIIYQKKHIQNSHPQSENLSEQEKVKKLKHLQDQYDFSDQNNKEMQSKENGKKNNKIEEIQVIQKYSQKQKFN